MNFSRLLLALVLGFCGLAFKPASAQAPTSPFSIDKQYSAAMVITTREGRTFSCKVNMDSGKMRSETDAGGMHVISITRPDEKKMYTLMPDQKMMIEHTLDAAKMSQRMHIPMDGNGKFELVGPDTVEGVPCLKYKLTTKGNRVMFCWQTVGTNAPVKMVAEDGSFTIIWKDYKAGPQDPSLFEPPADYQTMDIPGMPDGAGGQ